MIPKEERTWVLPIKVSLLLRRDAPEGVQERSGTVVEESIWEEFEQFVVEPKHRGLAWAWEEGLAKMLCKDRLPEAIVAEKGAALGMDPGVTLDRVVDPGPVIAHEIHAELASESSLERKLPPVERTNAGFSPT